MTYNLMGKLVPKTIAKALALAMLAGCLVAAPARAQDEPQDEAPPPPAQGAPQSSALSPQQLQELVAPIALYPDALVAQILAASAYPTQIVEAERFLRRKPRSQGQGFR